MYRTKKALSALPLLTINAGPRDGDKWKDRLKVAPTHDRSDADTNAWVCV